MLEDAQAAALVKIARMEVWLRFGGYSGVVAGRGDETAARAAVEAALDDLEREVEARVRLAESARIEALEAALRTALDICQDWIDNGDFDGPQSAPEAELLPLRAVLNLPTAIPAAPDEREAPASAP